MNKWLLQLTTQAIAQVVFLKPIIALCYAAEIFVEYFPFYHTNY
jgi:hypothetical protein